MSAGIDTSTPLLSPPALEDLSPTDGGPPFVSPILDNGSSDAVASPLAPKNQAAFVNKLYSMVEDPSIPDLTWSESGETFIVSNPIEFSKCLNNFFKHNNWQSFVRQLNMYQFHKVNDVFHPSSNVDSTAWEFKHPNFKRGQIELLAGIKRKASRPQAATREPYVVPRDSFLQQPILEEPPSSPVTSDRLARLELAFGNIDNRLRTIEDNQRSLIEHTSFVHGSLKDMQVMMLRLTNVVAPLAPLNPTIQTLQNDLFALSQHGAPTFGPPPPHHPSNGHHEQIPYTQQAQQHFQPLHHQAQQTAPRRPAAVPLQTPPPPPPPAPPQQYPPHNDPAYYSRTSMISPPPYAHGLIQQSPLQTPSSAMSGLHVSDEGYFRSPENTRQMREKRSFSNNMGQRGHVPTPPPSEATSQATNSTISQSSIASTNSAGSSSSNSRPGVSSSRGSSLHSLLNPASSFPTLAVLNEEDSDRKRRRHDS